MMKLETIQCFLKPGLHYRLLVSRGGSDVARGGVVHLATHLAADLVNTSSRDVQGRHVAPGFPKSWKTWREVARSCSVSPTSLPTS